MSNSSQIRTSCEQIENIDEIKVQIGENNKSRDDCRMEKMSRAYSNSDLNNKLNNDSVNLSMDNSGSDKNAGTGIKYTGNTKCLGDTECLDDSESDKTTSTGIKHTGNTECLDDIECLDNSDKQVGDANNMEDSNTEENESIDKSRKTYANAAKSNEWYATNKLLFVPTELNEAGDEVFVFDEELVELGSKKMWSRYRYKEIVDNRNGNRLFKFNNDVGMNAVANQSPWMVNSKPLMVKLTEVLMEAWTTKGISAINSSIGRQLIMDNMIAYVCKNGVGSTEYVRVLVEIDASKGLKKLVELQVKTEEELANEKVDATKIPIRQKEDGFMQYNGRRNTLNNGSRQGPNIFAKNNNNKPYNGTRGYSRQIRFGCGGMERGFLSQKGSGRGRGIKEKDLNGNKRNTTSGIGLSTQSDDTMNDDTLQNYLDDTTVPESFPPLSMPVTSTAGNAPGKSSYANITSKLSGKKVNVRTLFTPGKVAYHVVANYVRNTWGNYGLVHSMFSSSTGLFSFQFSSMDGLDSMLKNGLWFIRNNPLILKKWHPDENLLKEDVSTIPVWVKLHGVPVTTFSEDGLSDIATKLGIPLMLDSYTSDMCMQSWGRSSYVRVMIEFRDDVELKDNIVVAMPKITREGHYTCNVRVEYEWKPPWCSSCNIFGHIHEECPNNSGVGEKKTVKKPSQTSRGVLVGPKMGFKPQKEYRPVPKKTTASSNGNKKKGVEPTIEVSNPNPFNVLNSVDNDVVGTNGETTNLVNNKATSSGSSFMNLDNDGEFVSNTPIGEKIDKIERQIGKGKLRLLDNEGNPLVSTGIVESDSEVEVVFDDTANLRISTSGKDGSDKGYGTNSLLEQWRDSYPDNDDYDRYDDDMYENHDFSEHLQFIYDDLDITVRGRKNK
ncbi:nucleotide-diphospho-sugar transferase [Tanacetum coccineum]